MRVQRHEEAEVGVLTDDELAHSVMQSIADQLGWDAESTADWYAFALPQNVSDNNIVIQVRTVT